MTVPTEAELETEELINHDEALKEIPFTEKTILNFKAYFEKALGKKITDEETIKLMKSDPDPDVYFKKEMETRRTEEIQKNQDFHTDFIKDIMEQVNEETSV